MIKSRALAREDVSILAAVFGRSVDSSNTREALTSFQG